MEQVSYYASATGFCVIVALWFVFGWTFLLRKKPESTADTKRLSVSWYGLILQGAGMGVVWAIRREPFGSPLIDGQYAANIVLQIIGVVIAGASVWLALAAISELGRQWSLAARLTVDHKLVKSGVYGLVRHPIYTAMLGMLVGTGIAFSNWVGILAGVVVFIAGTKIRTIYEERLLAGAFGEEFTEWKAKVPGLIPFVKI
ncbi:protein-S-isoprenylcysteine O-methyltransferase [soil metagenome]